MTELDLLKKKLDYNGCNNCAFQIEPMRMCGWGEKLKNNATVYLMCPRWEHKESQR